MGRASLLKNILCPSAEVPSSAKMTVSHTSAFFSFMQSAFDHVFGTQVVECHSGLVFVTGTLLLMLQIWT